MTVSINGSGGITYPDGSVNTTRSVSTAGDTMTGKLKLPNIETNGTYAEILQTSLTGRSFQLLSTPSTGVNPNSWVVEDITGGYVRRLIIDSAGRVTKPYQPAFRIGLSSSVAAATVITMTGSTVFTNRGSNFNSSNGRFTAPVDGFYYFCASFRTNGIYSHHWDANWGAQVNGVSWIYSNIGQNTGDGETEYYTWRTITQGRYLSANDYVEFYYHNAYTNAGTVAFSMEATGYLVG